MVSRTGILGGLQTDFARNLRRDGRDLSDLCHEVVVGTLQAAGVEPGQIDSIHVGNAFGQLYTGQGHLGALPSTMVPELRSIPAMRHEAACASGSLAVLSAMSEIESGRYDCVLVVGIEQEKSLPSAQAAQVQAAAAYVGHEDEQTPYVWPQMFARIADALDRKHGLDDAQTLNIGGSFSTTVSFVVEAGQRDA